MSKPGIDWQEVPAEEVAELKFIKVGARKTPGMYDSLLEAVQKGCYVRVTVPDGVTPRTMSNRIQTLARTKSIPLTIRTLEDETALILSLKAEVLAEAEQAREEQAA